MLEIPNTLKKNRKDRKEAKREEVKREKRDGSENVMEDEA
jgi:hypothetical protein